MLQTQNRTVSFDKNLTKKLNIAIIRTDYYVDLNGNLETYCRKTLISHGVEEANIKTFVAPGSWEIPLIANKIAASQKFDAIIAFGIIVKGETYHFEMIANECARALMELSIDYGLPIALEVLAVMTLDQAKERAGDNDKNKGIEAANAVLKSIKTIKTI